MILLDTDILTLLFQGHSRVVMRLELAEENVGTTIITRIEILRGRFEAVLKAANSAQLQAAQQRLWDTEDQLSRVPILPIGKNAATQFDKLLNNKKLKNIGRGDVLIAAMALAVDATLVTRNVRDFKRVPDLKFENWAD